MEKVGLPRSIELQSKPRRVWQLSKIDLFATVVKLILSLQAPAFFAEDNLYFNYELPLKCIIRGYRYTVLPNVKVLPSCSSRKWVHAIFLLSSIVGLSGF